MAVCYLEVNFNWIKHLPPWPNGTELCIDDCVMQNMLGRKALLMVNADLLLFVFFVSIYRCMYSYLIYVVPKFLYYIIFMEQDICYEPQFYRY